MKNNKIPLLYCGDDNLRQSARYLYGVLKHLGYDPDYVPSRRFLTEQRLRKHYQAVILSDYPSAMISVPAQETLARMVNNGIGLLMIGGWGSFHGYDGNYDQSKLAAVLPVRCLSRDDRVNCSQGGVILPKKDWRFKNAKFKNGPLIGGYNRVVPKPGAKTLLAVRDLKVNLPHINLSKKEYPLLVTGCSGKGHIVCYMSDLAPHWSGGMVDWGQQKVKIENVAGYFMEVGRDYIKFIQALVNLSLSGSRHG